MSRVSRSSTRSARKPKASSPRPALVFRDFVRQLEKLDVKPAREGGR